MITLAVVLSNLCGWTGVVRVLAVSRKNSRTHRVQGIPPATRPTVRTDASTREKDGSQGWEEHLFYISTVILICVTLLTLLFQEPAVRRKFGLVGLVIRPVLMKLPFVRGYILFIFYEREREKVKYEIERGGERERE